MEEEIAVPAEVHQYRGWGVMSPEIVEISEDSRSMISSRDGVANDVYVAVGKDDLDVVKWALDHAISPGARVFLVHVYPPIPYIPTPVGKLPRSQLSQEWAQFYVNEENNRRRNLLQKYIRLCTDAKVTVDTMLVESNATGRAVLELIPVLNVTHLVMGSKRPHSLRRLMKGTGKGEFVHKNAPDFCEVTIVYDGNRIMDGQKVVPSGLAAASHRRPKMTRQSEKNFFNCVCFSGKSG